MKPSSLAMALTLALATSSLAFAQTGAQQPPPQPPTPTPPEEQPVYEEQVVVTASRVEQQLVNAPATVSVVTADVIASTPSTNYAELLRSVPGVNISQTSARDYNITMRGAASTLATSTLALLDGRSLYLDFFGFVAWDLLPVNPNELKQIEVIRGPASAVWGANALNGVVNFISKTPRELNGNSATLTFGTLQPQSGRRRAARRRVAVRHQRHARPRRQRSLGLQDLGGRLHLGRLRASGGHDSQRHRHAVPDLLEPGHHAAQVRHARRLRRAELQARVRGRLCRHRRHLPHRHRSRSTPPASASATGRCATRAAG